MKIKKWFGMAFATALVGSLLMAGSAPACALSGDEVQQRITEYYNAVSADGTPFWNADQSEKTLKQYADEGEYAKSVTRRQCPGKVIRTGCTSNSFGGGRQCFGFAKYMCYVVYGSYPQDARGDSVANGGGSHADGWTYYTKSFAGWPGLQPGDMIRWYREGTHAVMVYSVSDNGEVKVIDCNHSGRSSGGKCVIDMCTKQLQDIKRRYENGNAYICRHGDVEPTITTDRVEGLSAQEATLYGAVSSPGYVAEEIGMYIGTAPEEGALTWLGCDHPKGSSPIMWYSTRKYGYELQPGTTYYYQAYAVVEGKTYRGEILSFTTPQTGEASAENGESGVTDGGVYTLTPKCAPSACLDVDNGGKASKTNIQIYRSNGTASQKFKFTYVGNGYYTIEAMVSGKMLDVSGGKRDSKTNVWQYTSNGTIAQHWKLVDAGDGYYYLIPELNDDLALDVSGGGSKNKTNVWVYTRNQSDAQKWKLTPVS